MRNPDQSRGVVWFRRDLRLADNPAWAAATRNHAEVIGLFILEPRLMSAASRPRQDQLLVRLQALDESLRRQGGGLVVRTGPAATALLRVVIDGAASALYVNADYSQFSVRRDSAVVVGAGVPVHVFHGSTVHEPGSVLAHHGALSRVFTPFYRRWLETQRTPWPTAGAGRATTVPGEQLPKATRSLGGAAGEKGAWCRVEEWLTRVDAYADSRDALSGDGTSQLSTDLKFGSLSARALFDAVGTGTPGRDAFIRQLAWRDWWAHTLAAPSGTAESEITWRDDPEGFERWCAGRTGFPLVDAAMRQLVETGWIHNRLRMVCASFLVKDLLIDWRDGERFFRHHLIDSDPAQNIGNWRWVAGVGPDAAQFIRVFNPALQAKKFDPDGDYVRRWVPELARLPGAVIHEPALAGPHVLAAAGVIMGTTYPHPMVDHQMARARAIATYRAPRR